MNARASRAGRVERRARRCARGLAFAIALAPLAAAAAPPADLDCRALGPQAVARVLKPWPAPRVLALHGSVPIVTMEPFAAFLEAMGYPRASLAHPADGARTLSSYVDARRFAGEIAWHYEREGMMPMLVGHSQGGMVVLKALHELAGRNGPVPVFDPLTGEAQPRTWIVDPRTGARREVTDLVVDFAAVMATGSLPRLLLAQWDMLPLLRDVPDSVADFTGFSVPWDPIAGTGPDPAPFHARGSARVRSVVLPARYGHVGLPDLADLASRPDARAWIEAWRPGAAAPPAALADVPNLMQAADLWYSIRTHWCEAVKRGAGAHARAPS